MVSVGRIRVANRWLASGWLHECDQLASEPHGTWLSACNKFIASSLRRRPRLSRRHTRACGSAWHYAVLVRSRSCADRRRGREPEGYRVVSPSRLSRGFHPSSVSAVILHDPSHARRCLPVTCCACHWKAAAKASPDHFLLPQNSSALQLLFFGFANSAPPIRGLHVHFHHGSEKSHADHLGLTQVSNGGLHGDTGTGLELPSTTGVLAAARGALPDTGVGALDGGLTAVGAEVPLALKGFDALHPLTESITVTGTETTRDTDFLGALGHFVLEIERSKILPVV